MNDTTLFISVSLSLLSGVLLPIVLLYVRRYKNTTDALSNQRFQNIENQLKTHYAIVSQQLEKLEDKVNTYERTTERMRDRWDQFLRDFMKLDTSRGSKIDAMFRVLDTVNESIKQLRQDIEKLRTLEDRFQELKIQIVTLETIVKKEGTR